MKKMNRLFYILLIAWPVLLSLLSIMSYGWIWVFLGTIGCFYTAFCMGMYVMKKSKDRVIGELCEWISDIR